MALWRKAGPLGPDQLRKRLSDLADSGERGRPLVFAGRRAELQMLLKATQAGRLPPNGHPGGSVFIHGAPGAGKTSLVHAFKDALAKNQPKAAFVFCAKVPSEASLQLIHHRLLAHFLGGKVAQPGETTTKTKAGVIGVPGLGQAGVETGVHTNLPGSLDIASVAAKADRRRMRGRFPPLVIAIDEMQNLAPSTPAASFVEDLHTQSELPILLFGSGLSTSRQAITAAGISRTRADRSVTLGGLHPDEALACARQSLALLRSWGVFCAQEELDAWAECLAQASDNWPRHLHCYLSPLYSSLSKQDVPSLPATDLAEIVERGDALRSARYREAIEPTLAFLPIIGAIHAAISDAPSTIPEALEIISDARDHLLTDGRARSFNKIYPTDEDFMLKLLRSGVIESLPDGTICSPVPSMTDFVRAECERANIPFPGTQ